jgi:L-cysteine S-thiosulfotransferase
MVCQYHLRYVWLGISRPRQGEDPYRRDHGQRGRWPYIIWGVVMAVALTAVTRQSTAQEQRTAAGYPIIDGAIPEPLTAQPGDAERGRRIVLDRDGGDCSICHAMPLPQRQFHGTIGPPLDGVGDRYSAGELRLRLVDPKVLNPDTVMPAYHRVEGFHRVQERYRGKPILTAQQIEDVIAYLLTIHSP